MADTKISQLPAATQLQGSEILAAVQAGLSARTTVAAILAMSNLVPVAVPASGTDITAAINAALATCTALGGGVAVLPPGSWNQSAQINLSAANLGLVGAGSGSFTDSGTAIASATTLTWTGASAPSSAMVFVATPNVANANQNTGNIVSGIKLACNSLAGYGLLTKSVRLGRFANLHVEAPITAAYLLTCWTNGNMVVTDNQHNIYQQCTWRCLGSTAARAAHGMWLTTDSPTSNSNGNVSLNTFLQCYGENDGGSIVQQAFNGYISGTTLTVTSGTNPALGTFIQAASGSGIAGSTLVVSGSAGTYTVNNSQTFASAGSPQAINSYSSGNCVRIDAADNNTFIDLTCYRGSTPVPATLINGLNTNTDSNYFFHFSDSLATNAIAIAGTPSGYAFNPVKNMFFCADQQNGVQYPNLDTGVRVTWFNSNGTQILTPLIGAIFGPMPITNLGASETATLAQVAAMVGSTMSALFYNGSSNHFQLTDNTNTWGVNIDGTGNLRFSRVAGSGNPVCGVPFRNAHTLAPPSGGTAQCGVLVSSTANLGLFFGTGPPTFSAAEGSIYSNVTGAAGARLYVNTSSGSGTTWTALTTP